MGFWDCLGMAMLFLVMLMDKTVSVGFNSLGIKTLAYYSCTAISD